MSESLQESLYHYRPRNIVLATDFLESSRLALDYAVALAHRFGSTLTIVHVFELSSEAEEAEIIGRRPSVSRKMAMVRLEAFARGVQRLGIDVKPDLRDGDPHSAIIRSVVENQSDLLVLGTHGVYQGIRHFVIGSHAEKILLSAPCPVLTVGRHVMAGVDLDLKITDRLVITDVFCGSLSPFLLGLRLANEFKVPVDLVYVRPDGEATNSELGDRLAAHCRESLGHLANTVDPKWFSGEFHLGRIVDFKDAIERAESSATRLIVTGVHPMSRMERHFHASLAFELAARAASPLFSLPCAFDSLQERR